MCASRQDYILIPSSVKVRAGYETAENELPRLNETNCGCAGARYLVPKASAVD